MQFITQETKPLETPVNGSYENLPTLKKLKRRREEKTMRMKKPIQIYRTFQKQRGVRQHSPLSYKQIFMTMAQ